MAISTYLELKQAIQNWAKRTDILSLTDDFIDLAEADIWRDLRIRDMETRATGSLSGRTLALPSAYLEARKLRLTTTPSRELTYRTPESMAISQGSGIPTDYTITDQIEFNKTPDSTYGYELTYFRSLTALSASNATNAVLTRYPSVYLWAALNHFSDWAMNEELKRKYNAMYLASIQFANNSDKRGRYPSGKAMKTERPTP